MIARELKEKLRRRETQSRREGCGTYPLLLQ